MPKLMFILMFLSIGYGSISYADNFHIKNYNSTDLIASVFFDGAIEGKFTLKPGQEYVHSFWHNLTVDVFISNPKTHQEVCGLEVQEKKYTWDAEAWPILLTNYQPKVIHIHSYTPCANASSFDQANWSLVEAKRPAGPSFSDVVIRPWLGG